MLRFAHDIVDGAMLGRDAIIQHEVVPILHRQSVQQPPFEGIRVWVLCKSPSPHQKFTVERGDAFVTREPDLHVSLHGLLGRGSGYECSEEPNDDRLERPVADDASRAFNLVAEPSFGASLQASPCYQDSVCVFIFPSQAV